MEKIIPSFLMRHRYCPLPGIGTLVLAEKSASTVLGEQQITAPSPSISLSAKETDSTAFIGFIAAQQETNEAEAKKALSKFCEDIRSMEVYREVNMPYTGRFHIDTDGKLIFKPFELPAAFLPSVTAERVIRKDAVHQVRVGDTETTNVAMTAFYTGAQDEKRSFWWIAAMLLGAAGIAVVALYLSSPESQPGFGNSKKIMVNNGPLQTYTIPNP